MNELERKYRLAPRQASPSRLDDVILMHAAQKIPPKSHSPLAMSPWKTMAASFCVVGLGVALLLRYGVPPLSQSPATMEKPAGVAASGQFDAVDSVVEIRQQEAQLTARDLESKPSARTTLASTDAGGVQSESVGESISAIVDTAQDGLGKTQDATITSAQSVEIEPPAPAELEAPVAQNFAAESDKELVAVLPSPSQRARKEQTESVVSESGEALAEVLSEELFADSSRADTGMAVERADKLVDAITTNDRSLPSVLSPSLSKSKKISTNSQNQPQQPEAKSRATEQSFSDLKARSESAPINNRDSVVPKDAVDWIARQADAHFTLQLATASDAGYLEEFGQSLNLTKELYVLQLGGQSGKSEQSFGLFYGAFETVEEALTHIDSLDKNATRFSPWVRSFSRLRDEVTKP